MKRFSILFTSCLCAFLSHAQTLPYTFSVSQAPYESLNNATSVNNGNIWDDPEVLVPIGFNFSCFGQTFDQLYMPEGLAANAFGNPDLFNNPSPLIVSYGADLVDLGYEQGTSESPISYKTEGTAGNRIFKLEFANAGFLSDPTSSSYTNTQLWLFEGSNDVEIHFGPTSLNLDEDIFDGFTGPIIGFIHTFDPSADYFGNLWYLTGDPTNPTISLTTGDLIDTLVYTLSGAPGDGMVYRFSSIQAAVKNINNEGANVNVSPSLVHNKFHISLDPTAAEQGIQYRVVNQEGKQVGGGEMTSMMETVDVSELNPGIYFVQLYGAKGLFVTKKIVKQ